MGKLKSFPISTYSARSSPPSSSLGVRLPIEPGALCRYQHLAGKAPVTPQAPLSIHADTREEPKLRNSNGQVDGTGFGLTLSWRDIGVAPRGRENLCGSPFLGAGGINTQRDCPSDSIEESIRRIVSGLLVLLTKQWIRFCLQKAAFAGTAIDMAKH